MDKLFCFCHFCELHGPNVILTTHCLSESDLLSYMDLKRMDSNRVMSSLTSSLSSLPTNSLITDNSNLFDSEMHLMSDDLNGRTIGCDGCSLSNKSMDGFNGFLSFNDNKKFGFITNNYPNERNGWNSCAISNANIRDACIRSLSCEVYDSSEGEGLVYFGDDQRAHTLSYLFVLRDSKARGFQRTYSILVMSDNKQQLLKEWDFYVQSIEQIVSKLKTKSKIIYESELTQTTAQQRRSLILDNINVRPNMSSFEDIVDRNPLNTHRTNSKARSLLDLTGDNTTFAYLHSQFAWILFAVNSRNDSNPVMPSDSATLLPNDRNLCLRNFYRFVGKDKFLTIGYNVLIGNRIIVIDENNSRLKCLINCLSQLLPEECVSVRTDCQTFDESAKHNFIGISSLDLLPKHVIDSEFYALITICDKTVDKTNKLFSEKTKLTVHSKARLPERLPNYLLSIDNILTDFSYSDLTFNSYLISLKNEWLNRAQVYYTYTKGVNPPRSQSEINAMLKLISTEESDLKVIIFWSNNGLTIEYKTKVFSLNCGQNLLISNDFSNY